LLLWSLGIFPALFLSVAAIGQVAPEPTPAEPTGPNYKYQAMVGWGYTSTNMVNQSRSGLMGVDYSINRNFGNHFALTFAGGHYAWDVSANNVPKFSVDQYLGGVEYHAELYGKVDGFAHVLLGGEHVGGSEISIHPSVSFAGGPGLGVDYKLKPRLGLRFYGDIIGSSFTLQPFQPGFSTHRTWSARGGVGVVYHF
jgi:hypothetical protein